MKSLCSIGFALLTTVVLLTFSCSKDGDSAPSDPCANVTCDASKRCEDGACVCPTGYTGANCTEELFPSAVIIKEVTFLEFPMEDEQGNSWDLNNGPDLRISIVIGDDHNDPDNWLTSDLTFMNATSPGEYTFDVGWTLDKDLDETKLIFLQDDDPETDTAQDPSLGVVFLIPYDEGKNFPETVLLENDDFGLKAEAKLSYRF